MYVMSLIFRQNIVRFCGSRAVKSAAETTSPRTSLFENRTVSIPYYTQISTALREKRERDPRWKDTFSLGTKKRNGHSPARWRKVGRSQALTEAKETLRAIWQFLSAWTCFDGSAGPRPVSFSLLLLIAFAACRSLCPAPLYFTVSHRRLPYQPQHVLFPLTRMGPVPENYRGWSIFQPESASSLWNRRLLHFFSLFSYIHRCLPDLCACSIEMVRKKKGKKEKRRGRKINDENDLSRYRYCNKNFFND